VKAIILVGGEGTRLRPLTLTVPKQMLPVVEVPMIERVVGHYVRFGVSEVVLSLGYRPEPFLAAYPDGRCAGATLTYVVEPEPLDTAGAIRFAADRSGIAQLQEPFLVVNGDVLTDLDIGALITFHEQRGAEATIALTPVADPSAFGVVSTDVAGRVDAFIEKPALGTAPTNLINAGTYVFEPRVLDRIPDGRRVNVERETFPAMVADEVLFAMADDGWWIDVGTPERYLRATADVLSGCGRAGGEAPIAPGASQDDERVWRRGVSEVRGSVLGPAFVGREASVAAGAVVEQSVLSDGVEVDTDARVSASVVLAGARVGCRAQVHDSIIGPGAHVADDASVRGWSVIAADALVPAGAQLDGARH
jgi:mannose-1-phosphate guanylyltransferase